MTDSRISRSSRSPRTRCMATKRARVQVAATTFSPSRSTKRNCFKHSRGILATEPPIILIADDQPLNVELLEQELGGAGYRTISVASGEEAIAAAAKRQPDLILLDVIMAGIDGYEACARLKASEATRSIPVIVLTVLTDTFDKVRAFRAGAVDYITKPFETEELLARVAVHVALRREIEAHRASRATIRLL